MTRLQGNNCLSIRLIGSVALAPGITPNGSYRNIGSQWKLSPCKLDVSAIGPARQSLLISRYMSSQTGYRRKHNGLGEMIDAAMAGVWVAVRRRRNLFLLSVKKCLSFRVHSETSYQSDNLDSHEIWTLCQSRPQ